MEKRFSEIQQAVWGGFLGAYSRLNRQIEADLQEHARITHVEFEVLLRLYWQPDRRLRIQDLTAQSLLSQSGTSRVVERLEKAGLVTRESASEDRRGAYAVLTEAGAERFRLAKDSHISLVQDQFLDHFSVSELEQLAGFWKRLEEN